MWSITFSNVSLPIFIKKVLLMKVLIPLGKRNRYREKAHRFQITPNKIILSKHLQNIYLILL